MLKKINRDSTSKIEHLLVGAVLLYFLGAHLWLPSNISGILNPLSYCVIGSLCCWQWKRFVYVGTRDFFLITLVGLAIASIYWSAAPSVTQDEVKALVRNSLLGVYIAMRYPPSSQVSLYAWVLAVGATLSLLAGPSNVDIPGEVSRWIGIFASKNMLACTMTIGFLTFIFLIFENQKRFWLNFSMGGLSLLLLVLSQGKTALVTLVVALCLVPFRRLVTYQYKIRAAIFLIALLFSGGLIVIILNNMEFIFVDVLGKNLEFNGRIPIWNLMFEKINQRPTLGYGYAGFWTSDEAAFVVNNSWGFSARGTSIRFNAHSGYFDLLLQLGYVGLSLYVFQFVSTFSRVLKLLALNIAENFWTLQFLVVMLLLNLADSLSIVSPSSLWSIHVAISLATILQENRVKHLQKIARLEILPST